MPKQVWICNVTVVIVAFAFPARADLAISIDNATIAQGSTGTVDVWLTSDADNSSPDLLNQYGFTLLITGSNELIFSPSQIDYVSSGQYVFAGDSIAQTTSSPAGNPRRTTYTNDTFVGYDSTYSGTPFSLLSTNGPVLLAALTLDATITNAGESYSISLVPTLGVGSMNSNGQTFFDNFDFDTTGMEISAVPFTSTSGTVTIGPATMTTPEPSSLVIVSFVMVLLTGFHGVRRLRRARRGELA